MSTAVAPRETFSELLVSCARVDFARAPELDEDGCLTRTFRTLEIGAKEQDGKSFVITRKMCDQMAANFAWRQSRGYRTPAVVGHPGVGEKTPAKAWEKRIEAPAIGWAQSVEVKEDGLYVTVKFNATFSKQLLEGSYEFNSPSFAEQWTDEFGKRRGAVLIDVGILNYPLQEGMGSIMAASALAGGDTSMDPEMKQLLDDILSRIEALEKGGSGDPEEGGDMGSKLDEMAKRLTALESAASDEGKEEAAEDEKSALSALKAEIKSLSQRLTDDLAKLQDQADEAAKRTKEVTDKTHAAECLRFLSAQIDLGNLSPEKLPRDWKSKPAEAFDGLPFKSLAAAEAHYRGLKNTVVNMSGQLGRTNTTDAHSLADELWNASSMRETLIERFGDETKARRHYESLCAQVTPPDVSDED